MMTLKAARLNADKSMEEAAVCIGKSVSSYRRKEKGLQGIDFHEAYLLANLFKLSIDDLYFPPVGKSDRMDLYAICKSKVEAIGGQVILFLEADPGTVFQGGPRISSSVNKTEKPILWIPQKWLMTADHTEIQIVLGRFWRNIAIKE